MASAWYDCYFLIIEVYAITPFHEFVVLYAGGKTAFIKEDNEEQGGLLDISLLQTRDVAIYAVWFNKANPVRAPMNDHTLCRKDIH